MSDSGRAATGGGRGELRPPEPPRDPALEFLSRSWSASGAADVSRRALAGAPPPPPPAAAAAVIAEDVSEELDVDGSAASGSSFSFASAATSQLIMDRIMSQSQEVSPLTSGRLSHSSGPLNGGGSLSDSPPVSPDVDDNKFCRAVSTPKPQPYRGVGVGGGGKTVGRWLKERKEKKKEETRAHNAQVHAAVSVAAVAAAVAAVAAATAAASGSGRDDRAARTDMAVASAATLVAAQCVEAAESLGAERDHLAAAVASAVNVRTPGDIVTITAAAATALRGAVTLKARALKDVWNVAAVIPVEKNAIAAAASGGNHHHKHNAQKQQQQQHHRHHGNGSNTSSSFSDDVAVDDDDDENNFLTICSQELLARGTELLKRTRKGALHWKVVSVYIHRTGVVMLKMKSRHVAGTLTKKKKNVVVDVCRDVAAWPGRHLLEGGEHRRYFGLRTAEHRVIEFECSSQREHDMWTKGVARLLATVDGRRKRFA